MDFLDACSECSHAHHNYRGFGFVSQMDGLTYAFCGVKDCPKYVESVSVDGTPGFEAPESWKDDQPTVQPTVSEVTVVDDYGQIEGNVIE